MAKKECSVVQDLLPLYVEEMVKEETAQFVRKHLETCAGCQLELEAMRDAGETYVPEIAQEERMRPLMKIMKKWNRQTYMLSYTVIIVFILFGFSLTGGENLMYNSLIMPVVGIFGYIVFKSKVLFKMPILLLAIDFAVYCFGLVDLDLWSVIVWTCIYSIFVLIGAVIACLLHITFRKGMLRILKAAAFLAAVVLIGGVGFFANGLVGNPVSYKLAERTAKAYLEENYEGMGCEIERIFFSFKDGSYHAHIISPDSIDSDFTVTIAANGRVLYDNYESRVLQGWNTANRIEGEYRAAVKRVVDNPAFLYDCDIAYGEIVFTSESYEDDIRAEYAIVMEQLERDGFFDIREIGEQAGRLVIYVSDNTVTIERMSEVLLNIKDMMDKSGVAFYVIDCVLEYPRSEDGTRKDERIEVMDFLSSDIYEDGLIERVSQANAAAIAYYEKMDEKK